MANIRDFEPVLPDPQPYVKKALELYERAARAKRGHVVFIAAELGGGKTDHLNALAQALRQTKPAPNFIAGYFRGGEYVRYTLDWKENLCLKKTLLAAGETASLLSLFPNPYAFAAGFVGQLLQTSVSTHEFGNEFKKNPPSRKESASWLRQLLRHAVEEKPLVCLLDDWDEAQRFYWDDMLLSFAREITQGLPLLLFITVKEPIDLGAPEKDESGLASVIKTLTEKGLAEWWPLRKLSCDEVAAAIGQAAPGIAAKLHGMTGGNARWVRELWREWRLSEAVKPNEADCWVWGEQHKATVNLYEDILRDRLARLLKAETAMEVEEVRDALACAALEGVCFTADAVSMALGWDRDELIDLLDDVLVRTEENPGGLLSEEESVRINTPDGATRTLWRYRFLSDLQWLALARDGFVNEQRPDKSESERMKKASALAQALVETYAPEERFVAASIARLSRDVGRAEKARHYQRMADYTTDREVMREHALFMLTTDKDDWEQWQLGRAAKFLIDAAKAMVNVFPYDETLPVAEEACNLARRAGYEYDEAYACYVRGFILDAEGDYESARARAEDSLNIFRRIGKKDGIAISLSLLAQVDFKQGRHVEAREWATQTLEIMEEIGDRHGVAGSLHILAAIDFAEEHYADARERAAKMLKIEQEIGNRYGMATALNLLANVELTEGRLDEAREWAAQMLEIMEELGHRGGVGASLGVLAKIDYETGRYDEAREWATRALEIMEEMGNQEGVGMSLNLIAIIAYASEKPNEAIDLMTLGTLILTRIGHFDARIRGGDLEFLLTEQEYTEEDQQELLRRVSEAYQKDGGQELIDEALERLREANG